MTESTPEKTWAPGFDIASLSIRTGLCDDHLEELQGAIRRRQEYLAAERLLELEVGDQFYIVTSVRPQLLAGARVQVTGFKGDKVTGILKTYCSPKWRDGQSITLPKTLIGDKCTNLI